MQWKRIDVDTIPMTATVYIGLAVNSHNDSVLNVFTFDHVRISVPGHRSPLGRLGIRSAEEAEEFVVAPGLG